MTEPSVRVLGRGGSVFWENVARLLQARAPACAEMGPMRLSTKSAKAHSVMRQCLRRSRGEVEHTQCPG